MLLQDVLDKFDQHLYLADSVRQTLKVVLATAISNVTPGDPLWLFVVGPSSSGKTEILRTFWDYPMCDETDHFNSKGIEAWKKRINGKIWVTRYFSSMIGTRQAKRVISDLKTIYDDYSAKFTILAEATGQSMYEIDKRDHSFADTFLRVMIHYDDDDRIGAIEKALLKAGKEENYRAELSEVVQRFLDTKIENFDEKNYPIISAEIREQIVKLATNFPVSQALAERRVREFEKLIRAIAYIEDSREVTMEHFDLLYKVAMDSMPTLV